MIGGPVKSDKTASTFFRAASAASKPWSIRWLAHRNWKTVSTEFSSRLQAGRRRSVTLFGI